MNKSKQKLIISLFLFTFNTYIICILIIILLFEKNNYSLITLIECVLLPLNLIFILFTSVLLEINITSYLKNKKEIN